MGGINLKGVLTAGDDRAIREGCERGEDHTQKVFREELDDTVPVADMPIIESIVSRIQAVHDTV
ncbi:uncharacterized protein (TIGR02284 family) [Roseimicrobium gellanilyticum]|uniref:Uncharacterized protein (TIGR02284 family) n=1 Tax=Roseimicrobium gellanilyticum TaxID=748857 RepID=A0A366H7U2_9BACT|nr:hypothetical protein [Roseimicrobium gellanilyticum]RBP38126.1 uncharacterized protein (TIGR02284 family) [Roseimicrobium gellanilyticum]